MPRTPDPRVPSLSSLHSQLISSQFLSMPTSERPNTRPGSAPSPRTPFSEHHPIPITFFVPRSRILPSQASFHCHTRAHKPAPLLTILPHLRHLYAASPPQAAPTGSASANQAPPYGSALGPGPPEGGGPAESFTSFTRSFGALAGLNGQAISCTNLYSHLYAPFDTITHT